MNRLSRPTRRALIDCGEVNKIDTRSQINFLRCVDSLKQQKKIRIFYGFFNEKYRTKLVGRRRKCTVYCLLKLSVLSVINIYRVLKREK